MRILNICQDDWANFSYDNMKALQAVGIDCDSVKINQHAFYRQQSTVLPVHTITSLISGYDVIQYFHDHPTLFQTLHPELEKKKVIVYHTSSWYRRNYESVNALMNGIAHRSVNAMPEFMGLGAANEVYMVGAVDTDHIIPGPDAVGKSLRFAHFPSNAKVKGTDNILEVVYNTDINFTHSTSLVRYEEQLDRIDKCCDVYIEMLTDVDGNGMPYSNFGITALESAALGKVVITQCKDIDVYNSAYGFCALNLAKDKDKLRRHIETLNNYNGDYLLGQQQITRDWVVKNHSYKATGEYFLKHVI